jgi:hypothetical protein
LRLIVPSRLLPFFDHVKAPSIRLGAASVLLERSTEALIETSRDETKVAYYVIEAGNKEAVAVGMNQFIEPNVALESLSQGDEWLPDHVGQDCVIWLANQHERGDAGSNRCNNLCWSMKVMGNLYRPTLGKSKCNEGERVSRSLEPLDDQLSAAIEGDWTDGVPKPSPRIRQVE